MQAILKIIFDLISALFFGSGSAAPEKPQKAHVQPTDVSDLTPVKMHEALRLKAYLPTPNDKWTIGWGHTKTAKPGMQITTEQAEALLRQDAQWVNDVLRRRVLVPLTQPQYDALFSLVFNIGESNFVGSTVLRKLNAYEYVAAANAFLMWDKQRNKRTGKLEVLGGLVKRRNQERTLFLSGTAQ